MAQYLGAIDTYLFRHLKVGILSREHPESRRVHQADWTETVSLSGIGAKFQQYENLAQM